MSQFLNSPDSFTADDAERIDFDAAIPLPGGGSTCDLYRTRLQRREVFVKRLKEEFRSKPFYLDALDKEFDVGVGLHHPALPEYREFHGDYIVMDFIDGQTLAKMIRRDDPWLANERNLRRMLSELVDAVDYLHRHNVVHCDIKPDNIIITANSKNLVLIDFDKSYTDALNDTSGHPGRYGLPADSPGRTAIDFRGIALVVERLRAGVSGFRLSDYKRFLRACNAPDANCETLARILAARRPSVYYKAGAGLLALAILAAIFIFLTRGRTETGVDDAPAVIPATPAADTIPLPEPEQQPKPQPQPVEASPSFEVEETPEQQLQMDIAGLEYGLAPYFNDLIERLDKLDQIRQDTTLTRSELKRHWDSYNAMEDKIISDALGQAVGLLPGVKDNEIGDYISATDPWRNYIRRARRVKDEYHAEMRRRQ